jgi:hypothetical protein
MMAWWSVQRERERQRQRERDRETSESEKESLAPHATEDICIAATHDKIHRSAEGQTDRQRKVKRGRKGRWIDWVTCRLNQRHRWQP